MSDSAVTVNNAALGMGTAARKLVAPTAVFANFKGHRASSIELRHNGGSGALGPTLRGRGAHRCLRRAHACRGGPDHHDPALAHQPANRTVVGVQPTTRGFGSG